MVPYHIKLLTSVSSEKYEIFFFILATIAVNIEIKKTLMKFLPRYSFLESIEVVCSLVA
jgi:hypothetical protein